MNKIIFSLAFLVSFISFGQSVLSPNVNNNSLDLKLKPLPAFPSNYKLLNTPPGKTINQSYPSNGYSPYNSYFGSGDYNYDDANWIKVNTPKNSDIVFVVRDVFTGKTIRNNFIRKNSSFTLSDIPNGTYEFIYFSGNDWSFIEKMKNGKIKGGFTKNKSFSRSENISDRIVFKEGYYGGGVTLSLTQVYNGNLETKPADEEDFF